VGLSPYPGLEDTPEAAVLVSQFLSDLGRLLKEPTPAVVRREIQEASLALAARLETIRSRNSRDLRVKILCYEGLGMSNYILAIARDVFPKGTAFNAAWDPDFERSSDSDAYHLVISTFPLHVRGARQLILNGDSSPEELRIQLKETIREMHLQPDPVPRSRKSAGQPDEQELQSLSVDDQGYSLTDIMSVIGGFFVEMEAPGGDLISQAVSALNRGDCDTESLVRDFERRESFGSLVFEELNIRILHCRSEGIPEPRAGVIQTEGDEETILVLAAPLSARQSQTHALSEIVISLTDYPDFPGILARGSKREIQSHLLSIFGQKN
jgi:mannitol operon transcriptional antiterminator